MSGTTGRSLVSTSGGTLEIVSHLGGHHDRPLLVCLAGGGYTKEYFDVEGASFLQAASERGFDVVAVDRPGYGASDLGSMQERTFAHQAGVIDGAVSVLAGGRESPSYPGVVLVGHSMGLIIALHVAGRRERGWPLLAVTGSGVGYERVNPHARQRLEALPAGEPLVLTRAERRERFYGPDGSFDPQVLQAAALSEVPGPIEEYFEVITYAQQVSKLAAGVRVPVQVALGEHDSIWVADAEHAAALGALFTASPHVESVVLPGVGHAVDHHYAGAAWHQAQLDFVQAWARP